MGKGSAHSPHIFLRRHIVPAGYGVSRRGQGAVPDPTLVLADGTTAVEPAYVGWQFLHVVRGAGHHRVLGPVSSVSQVASHHDCRSVFPGNGNHSASSFGGPPQPVSDRGNPKGPPGATPGTRADPLGPPIESTIFPPPERRVVPSIR